MEGKTSIVIFLGSRQKKNNKGAKYFGGILKYLRAKWFFLLTYYRICHIYAFIEVILIVIAPYKCHTVS